MVRQCVFWISRHRNNDGLRERLPLRATNRPQGKAGLKNPVPNQIQFGLQCVKKLMQPLMKNLLHADIGEFDAQLAQVLFGRYSETSQPGDQESPTG